MDIEKLIEAVKLCGSTPKVDQCKQCTYWSGGDMSKCIPRMTTDAALALSTLQAENKAMQKQLNEFSEFLCRMTGGLLSKTNYTAQVMATIAEDYQQKACRECNLQAENEKPREMYQKEKAVCHAVQAELEQVKRALAMMWFSYVNSDKEMPHSYETEALDEAERILGPWAECMPKYLRRGQKED